jgi:hypothetical protein
MYVSPCGSLHWTETTIPEGPVCFLLSSHLAVALWFSGLSETYMDDRCGIFNAFYF